MRYFNLLIIALLFQTGLTAQSSNFTKAFVSKDLKQDESASTFLTMESVLHGISGNLKGVEVKLLPSEDGVSTANIRFSNPTGEPWNYQIFSADGQIIAEGSAGYERIVPVPHPGQYLIRYTNRSGLRAFDELAVKPPSEKSIMLQKPAIAGQADSQ